MARIVMKFGGTSVGDIERIRNVAQKIKAEKSSAATRSPSWFRPWPGDQPAGQMGARARAAARCAGIRRRGLATGEQITVGLLALALQRLGVQARGPGWAGSFLSAPTPRYGKARIVDIKTTALHDERMAAGEVADRAGLPGARRPRAALRRSAAAARTPQRWRWRRRSRPTAATSIPMSTASIPAIPASSTKARKINRVTYEEMLEMASQGSKVLQTRSVELAMNHHVRAAGAVVVRCGTGSDLPGTMVVRRGRDRGARARESGLPASPSPSDEAKITVIRVADQPGVAAAIFGPLADANINVDMIVQNVSLDGRSTDITFTVPRADLGARRRGDRRRAKAKIGSRSQVRHQRRQGLGHRRRHAQPRRRRPEHVPDAGRARASTSR